MDAPGSRACSAPDHGACPATSQGSGRHLRQGEVGHCSACHEALAKVSPRQPHPGARHHRYRCSLPGLTGFTTSRRGGTSAGPAQGMRCPPPRQAARGFATAFVPLDNTME